MTVTSLSLGVPVTNLAAGSRQKMFFKLSVPSGSFVQLLDIRTSGGSGNADLFVRNSYLPTTSSYTWSSRWANNNEEITFPVSSFSKFSISFKACYIASGPRTSDHFDDVLMSNSLHLK